MTPRPATAPIEARTVSATAFVAGATGFTGREVVPLLVERGIRTIAHVRPDSSRLEQWRERFTEAGAEVDTTPWVREAMAERLDGVDTVFSLLGTTRHRARGEGMSRAEAYERVDYGLTALLLDAAVDAGATARFVYLSSIGASARSRNLYLQTRARCETAIVSSGIPHVIVRPSFIVGAGRDDPRPGERVSAVVSDAALAVVGLLGARSVRARYKSTTNRSLARALVHVAYDPDSVNRTIEGIELRAAMSGR